MVTIVDYAKWQNSDGDDFYSLILQGGLEMVKSKETGQYYATAKRASVTSTFDEEGCKKLLGKEIPGFIKRIPAKPYEYTIPGTGEVVMLEHHWVYRKEGESAKVLT